MDREEHKQHMISLLAEIDERLAVLDMMDERLYKIKDLLIEIRQGNLSKKEEESIRKEIQVLEEEFNLLNQEKNIQS